MKLFFGSWKKNDSFEKGWSISCTILNEIYDANYLNKIYRILTHKPHNMFDNEFDYLLTIKVWFLKKFIRNHQMKWRTIELLREKAHAHNTRKISVYYSLHRSDCARFCVTVNAILFARQIWTTNSTSKHITHCVDGNNARRSSRNHSHTPASIWRMVTA